MAEFGFGSICQDDGFCSAGRDGLDEPRIGIVLSSPQDDGGWSETHFNGAQEAAEALGAPLVFEPSIPGGMLENVIDGFVENSDSNIIITPSSGYITGTLNSANRYEDRFFLSCCGKATADNLGSYFGRMYQPLYVLGYLAGRKSCTERLGVVAAFPFPEFVRHINAFTLGAKLANPAIVVDIRYVMSFFDPAVEGQSAADLIANGADVLLSQANSLAVLQEQAGSSIDCNGNPTPILRVGYNSPDACDANPAQCLSSAFWNWGALYTERIQSIIDGSFDPGDNGWSPMTNSSDSVIAYADPNPALVSAAIVADLGAVRTSTIDDPQVPFVGPLSDNTNTPRIALGEELSDEQLDSMCYYVNGVVDSISGTTVPAVVPSSCGE